MAEYVITVKKDANWEELNTELTTDTSADASVDSSIIPDREVSVTDLRETNTRNTNYDLTEEEATAFLNSCIEKTYDISSLETKPSTRKPAPPFTTSTLQQEASRKLGFSVAQTMTVAQRLYESGKITYMRTDSVNLSDTAIEAASEEINTAYGSEYLETRKFKNKASGAQEAHEAIRPAASHFDPPSHLKSELSSDQYRLFEIIWKRTIACQMVDARERSIVVKIEGEEAVLESRGKTIDFPGYLRAYVEGSDNPQQELAGKERLLPVLKAEQSVDCQDVMGNGHSTKPPARFTEASLTRKLEEMGIGRPSTYASIIDTILYREYVFKREK